MKANFPRKGSLVSLVLSVINFCYEVFAPGYAEKKKENGENDEDDDDTTDPNPE